MWGSLSNASLSLQSFVDWLGYSWQSQLVLGLPSALALFVLKPPFLFIYIYILRASEFVYWILLSPPVCVSCQNKHVYRIQVRTHIHLDELFFFLSLLGYIINPGRKPIWDEFGSVVRIHGARPCRVLCHFHVSLSCIMFRLGLLRRPCIVGQ